MLFGIIFFLIIVLFICCMNLNTGIKLVEEWKPRYIELSDQLHNYNDENRNKIYQIRATIDQKDEQLKIKIYQQSKKIEELQNKINSLHYENADLRKQVENLQNSFSRLDEGVRGYIDRISRIRNNCE